MEAPPKEEVPSKASVLGKTCGENHLGLMRRGTVRALGGKLLLKSNINLPFYRITMFPSPARIEGLAGDEGGSREGAPAAPGWGREKGVGSSLGGPVAGTRGRSSPVAWRVNFFQGLVPGVSTGGRWLAIDQLTRLHVT